MNGIIDNNSIITNLAEQCLNEKGQEAVKDLLLAGKIDIAKIYILGAIDSLWHKKQINDSEATEAYRVLGIAPEKICKIRQDNSDLWG